MISNPALNELFSNIILYLFVIVRYSFRQKEERIEMMIFWKTLFLGVYFVGIKLPAR